MVVETFNVMKELFYCIKTIFVYRLHDTIQHMLYKTVPETLSLNIHQIISNTTHSYPIEIFNIIIISMISLSINWRNSLLTGYLCILIIFTVLHKITLLNMLIVCTISIFLIRNAFSTIKKPNEIMNINIQRNHIFILRAGIMVLTVISIFMSNFENLWNNKFDKTVYKGISLLDTGIPGFIFINAFCRNFSYNNLFNKKIISLIVFGIFQFIINMGLKWYIKIEKKNNYLNFYFMLAIYDILYNLYKKIFNLFYLFDTIIAITMLLIWYNIININYVLNDKGYLWFTQNKEELYSIVPHMAFFLIISDFGRIYEKIQFKYTLSLAYFIGILLIYIKSVAIYKEISLTKKNILIILNDDIVEYVSKKTSNLFYILWSLLVCFFSFVVTFTICKFFPHSINNNTMVQFISDNLMFIFVCANICTFILERYNVNMNYGQSILVNLVYLFIIFVILGLIMKPYKYLNQKRTVPLYYRPKIKNY